MTARKGPEERRRLREGGLVWIDFDDVCLGPTEWVLATMMDPEAVAAHYQPDPEVLARCTELRALQVALCAWRCSTRTSVTLKAGRRASGAWRACSRPDPWRGRQTD